MLFQPKGGPLLLFYKVGPDEPLWWGEVADSNDGGKTWLTVDANESVLFDLPYAERWQAAVRLLGIDASRLGPDAGHA